MFRFRVYIVLLSAFALLFGFVQNLARVCFEWLVNGLVSVRIYAHIYTN